jgi:hypothetical protein
MKKVILLRRLDEEILKRLPEEVRLLLVFSEEVERVGR